MAAFSQYTVLTRATAPGAPGGFVWTAVFDDSSKNQAIANGNTNVVTVLNQLAKLGWTLVGVGDVGGNGADEMIFGK
jgi:hypothetical protein